MKTTLNLCDALVARAQALATKESTTLTQLIEEGLTLRLRKAPRASEVVVKNLPVSTRRGGLRVGIDATRNHLLFDAADD